MRPSIVFLPPVPREPGSESTPPICACELAAKIALSTSRHAKENQRCNLCICQARTIIFVFSLDQKLERANSVVPRSFIEGTAAPNAVNFRQAEKRLSPAYHGH